MNHQYAIMVTMTADATGHRTPDTGHPPRPVLRSHAPETTLPGVPFTTPQDEGGAGHRTPDTTLPVARDTQPDGHGPDPRPVPLSTQPDTWHNGTPDTATHRTPNGTSGEVSGKPSRNLVSRGITAGRDARAKRDARLRDTADAQRAARDASRRDATATRDALMAAAGKQQRRRPTGPQGTEADKIAPIPLWMQKASVWGMRSVGSLLPLAPLLVSGYVTVQIGRDEPLNMGWMAIFFTFGLEGAVWYLSKLREQFRLEGDGTFSITIAVYGIVLLIAGLISAHAIWNHTGRQPVNIPLPGTDTTVPLSELMPAMAIAVMSAIGTFVWAKKATYQHRAKLRALNMIDPRAPKFSSGAWATSPWETFWALRHFFKYRVAGGADEVTKDWRLWKATGKPKIWPIPAGFRYEGGRFIQLTADELRDAIERDALIESLAVRDTDPTGHPDTPPAITGHPDTGRPAINPMPAGHRTLGNGTPGTTAAGRYGTPVTGQHGTPVTGQHGTSGTGRDRTPDTPREPDSHGTNVLGNGTPEPQHHGTPDTSGTPDGPGTPSDLIAADAEALKDSGYIMIVTEAFQTWRTDPKPPSVRGIKAAINDHRQRTDGGTFNSMDIAGRVREAIIRCRENPGLYDLVRQLEGNDRTN